MTLLKEHQGIRWSPVAKVEKWDDDMVAFVQARTGLRNPNGDALRYWVQPWETRIVPGNLLTTAGLTRLTSLLTGGGGQAMTNTATRLGVGDDATAAAVGDVDLSTGANQYYRVMDATYPQVSGGVVTLKSTFGTGDANFTWASWGVDIGTPTVSSSGTVGTPLFNRKVAALGTKASGTWTLTVTITFS